MSELSLVQHELPPEVRLAIRHCAAEIISTESKCIEWGVEPESSVETAAETIAKLIKTLQFSGQLTTYAEAVHE